MMLSLQVSLNCKDSGGRWVLVPPIVHLSSMGLQQKGPKYEFENRN
jgi:hypothetical protein